MLSYSFLRPQSGLRLKLTDLTEIIQILVRKPLQQFKFTIFFKIFNVQHVSFVVAEVAGGPWLAAHVQDGRAGLRAIMMMFATNKNL